MDDKNSIISCIELRKIPCRTPNWNVTPLSRYTLDNVEPRVGSIPTADLWEFACVKFGLSV